MTLPTVDPESRSPRDVAREKLDDSYDAVRQIADRSLRSLPGIAPYGYDALAPAAERRAAGGRALESWRGARGGSSREAAPHLLLDPSGQPMREEFSRLLRERDQRRILIAE